MSKKTLLANIAFAIVYWGLLRWKKHILARDQHKLLPASVQAIGHPLMIEAVNITTNIPVDPARIRKPAGRQTTIIYATDGSRLISNGQQYPLGAVNIEGPAGEQIAIEDWQVFLLVTEDGRICVMDAGSIRGNYVNGLRLWPGTVLPIEEGTWVRMTDPDFGPHFHLSRLPDSGKERRYQLHIETPAAWKPESLDAGNCLRQ